MKRDLELVRAILQSVRDKGTIGDYPLWSQDEIAYHRNMLVNAEFLEKKAAIASQYELTWEGHEILDGMGDDEEWAHLKESTAKAGLNIATIGWETVASVITGARVCYE